MAIALVFLFGLILGSFLNVVIFRLDGRDSIFISRSKCFHCGKILSWYELIPVISFAVQKGHCRSCGLKLSFQYPLVEITTGAALAYFYLYNSQNFLNFFFNTLFFSLLLVVFFYDIKHKIIPDVIVYPLILFGLARESYHYYLGIPVKENLIVAFGISFFFFLLLFISQRNWMGLGDAKLIFATSLLAGYPRALSAFLFAFWAGAIYAIPLLFLKKADMSSRVPFGPFIILGFLISLFYQL